jgi:hypothetical protein
MRKISKKERERRVDAIVYPAIRGLQIPILTIPAIYKLAEGLVSPDGTTTEAAIESVRQYAVTLSEEIV